MSIATVLNVDDYLPGRYAKTRVLRDAGFRVIEAASGSDALRLVRDEAPDVVLLDNNLPDMPGVDVCRAIKETPATEAIPVLQISATARTVETKVEAMKVGADTYLTEPIAPAELVAHIRAALRWRRAEERLRESNTRITALYEEAKRANQAKDDFLAILSHELRTPLNAMFGWIQLLRSGRLSEIQSTQAIETIERNAAAQARLIEDLLDVSRIVTHQLSIVAEPVDVVPLVLEAVDNVRPQAQQKGLAIVVNVPDEAACVNGDPARLRQVTTNLLSNAIKFTDHGTITLSLERADGRVRIRVTDTGVGVEPEFLPFVFNRFTQADTSRTRPHGGLGLGLAISRHLIEAHGGTITAESGGPGRGATFVIDLPELQDVPVARAEAPVATSGRSERPLEGLRLVLVEDDPDSREMMALLLEHSGAVVATAANAKAAREIVEGQAPDIMIADVGLPQIDGYSLVRELRAAGCLIPTVALTGYASSTDKARAMEAGFNAHLGKPVDPDQLVEVLARLTRAART